MGGRDASGIGRAMQSASCVCVCVLAGCTDLRAKNRPADQRREDVRREVRASESALDKARAIVRHDHLRAATTTAHIDVDRGNGESPMQWYVKKVGSCEACTSRRQVIVRQCVACWCEEQRQRLKCSGALTSSDGTGARVGVWVGACPHTHEHPRPMLAEWHQRASDHTTRPTAPPRRHTCLVRSAVYHTHAESTRQAKVKRDGRVSGVVRPSFTNDQLRQHELQHHATTTAAASRSEASQPTDTQPPSRSTMGPHVRKRTRTHTAQVHTHTHTTHVTALSPTPTPAPQSLPICANPCVCVLCGEPERVWLTWRGRG
jgi:hypothetical protein